MLKKITDFLYDRTESLKHWDKTRLYEALSFYAYNGNLIAITDEKDNVLAACVIRIINSGNKKELDDVYAHDPFGDTYQAEHMASDSKTATKKMIDIGINRFGLKKYASFDRYSDHKGQRMITLPFLKFKKIFEGN